MTDAIDRKGRKLEVGDRVRFRDGLTDSLTKDWVVEIIEIDGPAVTMRWATGALPGNRDVRRAAHPTRIDPEGEDE